LQDEGRCRRRDAIRRHGASIDRRIEESKLPVLGARLPCGGAAGVKPRKAGRGSRRRGGRRALPRLEEDGAEARGFLLGAAALLGLVDARCRNDRRHDGLAGILRGQDGAAQIARQRRSKNGTCVVARQSGKTIGGLAVGRRI
jgi:hypothetical protein